jgi:cell division protein FtsB
MVVCALALSVAVPLRTYLSQQAEIQAAESHRADLSREREELERRGQRLSDPAQIEASSRERLQYVRPGEIPFIVQLPEIPAETVPQEQQRAPARPWYERLWTSIAEG